MTRATILAGFLAVLALTPGCGGEDDPEKQAEVFTDQFYEADDPNILYTGRVDYTNPKNVRFSAPGVYITARFRGTGVSATLVDQHLYGKYQNYFDVVIDGGEPTKLAVSADQTSFVLASGLAQASTPSRSRSAPSRASATRSSAASRSPVRSCRRRSALRAASSSSATRSPAAPGARRRTDRRSAKRTAGVSRTTTRTARTAPCSRALSTRSTR